MQTALVASRPRTMKTALLHAEREAYGPPALPYSFTSQKNPPASHMAATPSRTIPCDDFQAPAVIHFIHVVNNRPGEPRGPHSAATRQFHQIAKEHRHRNAANV